MYKEGLSSKGSVIGLHSLFYDEIDSTNDEAKRLVSKSNPIEGTVIYSNNQWLGRGQIDSHWQSEGGKNIILSFIIYPEFLKIERNFDLNIWISTSIVAALSTYCDRVQIKWPNDIYIGEKKIGGILIENSIRGQLLANSIVGIGLNINQTDFEGLPRATSLAIETQRSYNLNTLTEELLATLDKTYLSIRYGVSFKEAYLNHLLGNGTDRLFRDRRTDQIIRGMIQGIDPQGRLMIFNQTGVSYFWMKEIEFLFDVDSD